MSYGLTAKGSSSRMACKKPGHIRLRLQQLLQKSSSKDLLNFAPIYNFTLGLEMLKIFNENQHLYFKKSFNQL